MLSEFVEGWHDIGATHVSVSGLGASRSPTEHLRFAARAARVLELR